MTAQSAPALDVTGTELKIGDWVVQPYLLGRCASLKFAHIVGFSQSGNPRLVGFESCEDEYIKGQGWVPTSHGWARNGPYTVQFASRMLKINEPGVPDTLRAFIADVFGGQPGAARPTEL